MIKHAKMLAKGVKLTKGSPTSADAIVSSPFLSVILMATLGESTMTSSDRPVWMSPWIPRSTSLATVLLVRSYWQVTAKPRSEDVTIVS